MDSQNQLSPASAILQLAACEKDTKIHSAFSKIFWEYEFDFFEDFQIGVDRPLSEGSFFALRLGKINLDREAEELGFCPGWAKTIDLAKEMEKQLGVTPCDTLILEVIKANWEATQSCKPTVEVQVVAVVQSVPKI
jgi:hypothetical protein